MGHAEFLQTQKAKEKRRIKNRKKIRRHNSYNKACGIIELVICFCITVLFFCGNLILGLFAAVFLLLPALIDHFKGTITRPPWNTVKGEEDCPLCFGKYFIHQGLKTYWLGWKECSCQPHREFNRYKIGERNGNDL